MFRSATIKYLCRQNIQGACRLKTHLGALCFLIVGLASASFAQELPVVEPVKPADIYSGLVAETLRGLIEEVLILGLFIVGVGHFRHALRDPSYLRSIPFAKRFGLLAGVMLFVTYMKLTYSVEWALGIESLVDQAKIEFSTAQRHQASFMVILLTPIDLCIVALMAGMFIVLALDDYVQEKPSNKREQSLCSDLKYLYILTGAAHGVTILWWLFFAVLSGDGISRWSDIAFHAIFALLHLFGFLALKRAGFACSSRSEGWHVSWFVLLTVSVYVLRLWIYIFRYTS